MTQYHNMSKREYEMVDFLNPNHQTGDVSHMPLITWVQEGRLSSGKQGEEKGKKEGSFFKGKILV